MIYSINTFLIFTNKQKQLNSHIQFLFYKWVVSEYQYSFIDEYLIWRKKWFQDTYLNKSNEDVDDDNLFDMNKKEEGI